jgi:hypothetical protein
MKGASDEKFCDDFIRGYNDCKNDVKHTDQGKAYHRGYSTRYTEERNLEHKYRER